MGVFHVFKIVQMVPSCAKRFIYVSSVHIFEVLRVKYQNNMRITVFFDIYIYIIYKYQYMKYI